MKKLTHIDDAGQAAMVDVSAKPVQQREAVARGEIRLLRSTLVMITGDRIAKGNVLATARIAGIQAAKMRRTHPALPSPADHVLRGEL